MILKQNKQIIAKIVMLLSQNMLVIYVLQVKVVFTRLLLNKRAFLGVLGTVNRFCCLAQNIILFSPLDV